MARKKGNSNSSMGQLQGDLVAAVDQVVGTIENQIVDHAETRLFNFVLGGGLADELAARMMPHLEAFTNQVGIVSAPQSVSLIGGDSTVDVVVNDV